MAVSNPKYLPGQDPTLHASEAVTGARFVSLDTAVSEHADGHAQAKHTAAAAKPFGVAATDAADETKFLCFRSGVVEVEAAAAVQHGDPVEVAADGKVTPLAAGVRVGVAYADAAINTKALIALELGA